MANTYTNLVPDAYAALDVVSRELVGLIPAVQRDLRADRLAVGQTLRSPVTPVNTAGADITPAMALPSAAYQAIANVPFTLTKYRRFPFSWQDEERYALDQGPGVLTIQQQQIAQAMRAAVGEISVDLYAAARAGASRAWGTAGTTPFGTNLGESAQVKKILDDNGAPASDRSLVIGTTAGAALRTLLNNPLTANNTLSSGMSGQGVLIPINGFAFREEAKISTVTKGTGTGYLVNNSGGYAVGATAITVDTGSGTVLAGDIITFNGDTNKYVVASALSGGVITLAAPGLLKAAADNAAITVGNNFDANLAFSQNAILLGTRLPIRPQKDLASMVATVTDPVSGLSFEISQYPGYRMSTYEVAIAWGVAIEKPEHIAIMLG